MDDHTWSVKLASNLRSQLTPARPWQKQNPASWTLLTNTKMERPWPIMPHGTHHLAAWPCGLPPSKTRRGRREHSFLKTLYYIKCRASSKDGSSVACVQRPTRTCIQCASVCTNHGGVTRFLVELNLKTVSDFENEIMAHGQKKTPHFRS